MLGPKVWSVGLQSFRPRRPTFLEVKLLPHLVWERQVVLPVYDRNDDAVVRTVHEGLAELDLEIPCSVKLFRYVSFDRRLPGWKPDRLLTIEPVSKHISDFDDEIFFWGGASEELAKYHEQLAKAAAAAARREQSRQAGEQPKPREKRPKSEGPRSGQADAVRKAKKDSAEHQAVLAICDGKSGTVGASEEESHFWAEIFDGDDSDDSAEEKQLPGQAAELDVSVLSLLEAPEDEGRKLHDDNYSDMDSDEIFGDPKDPPVKMKEPVMKVSIPVEKPDGVEDGEESVMYSPTSAEASSSSSSTSGSESSGKSSSGSTSGTASKRKRRRKSTRGTCTASAEAPPGCTLRKYEPDPPKPPFWIGVLAEGMNDKKGKHSRRRAFREGLRTEPQALAEVEAWLIMTCEDQVDASESDRDKPSEG